MHGKNFKVVVYWIYLSIIILVTVFHSNNLSSSYICRKTETEQRMIS